jgi:ATP-dependent Zn protease
MAVRRGEQLVAMEDFDLAIERMVAGLQRDKPLKGEVRRKVAYHEGSHALVSQLLPLTDRVHRVSIIPTSKGALGYTMEMPEEDRYLMSESALHEIACRLQEVEVIEGSEVERIVAETRSLKWVDDTPTHRDQDKSWRLNAPGVIKEWRKRKELSAE